MRDGSTHENVKEASRAHPKGLACLSNIYNLEMYQLFLNEPLSFTEAKHCTSSIFLTLRDSGINISFY
jgi:hypothetical protein